MLTKPTLHPIELQQVNGVFWFLVLVNLTEGEVAAAIKNKQPIRYYRDGRWHEGKTFLAYRKIKA
jgi:hypothetical protein